MMDWNIPTLPTEYEDCVVPGGVTPNDSFPGRVIALDGDPLDWPMRERPIIYIAGYLSANPMHGTANAVKAADAFEAAGWLPFVPHASVVYDMLSPHTPDWWYEYDLGLLARCDAMFVCPDTLTMDSKGVAKEIDFALRHDIPVLYEVVEAKDRYDQ